MVGGVRLFSSWVLALATTALAVLAIASVWADRQLLDSDTWTQHSVEVLRDPEVQRLTAGFLADELVNQQATTDGIAAALPQQLQGLTGTARSVLHALAERTALEALQARALEPLWADAMGATHAQFLAWLDGQGATTRGDQVELDLQPILAALARRVGVPESLITAGASAGGAQIAVIEAGQYERTREDSRRLEQLASAMLPLTALAAALSVIVAGRRRWATVRVGVAISAAGLIVLAGAGAIGDRFVGNLIDDGAAPAVARAIWDAVGPPLTQSALITAVGGAGLAVLALLFWPRRNGPLPTAPATTRPARPPRVRTAA